MGGTRSMPKDEKRASRPLSARIQGYLAAHCPQAQPWYDCGQLWQVKARHGKAPHKEKPRQLAGVSQCVSRFLVGAGDAAGIRWT